MLKTSKKGNKYIIDSSRSPVIIGLITKGLKIPHHHKLVYEYFIIDKGHMDIKVGKDLVMLDAGDVLMVEPGEKHSIQETSADLRCYIVKYPNDNSDKHLSLLGFSIRIP